MKIGKDRESGAYFIEGEPPKALKRFTVFAFYPFDAAALALDEDALHGLANAGEGSVEEIDVDATSHDSAREIAKVALAEGYEPGWAIIGEEERVGWYF